ncbi:HNH endonuclease [Pseudomonas sp. TE3610]
MPLSTFRNRKAFIQSLGATCRNWTWSWSFVNEQERHIIFGAWDINTHGDRALILSDRWEIENGRRNRGYGQSLEHVRMVEEHGYQLFTFAIRHSDERQDALGNGPATIKGFDQEVRPKRLVREGGKWYACDELAPAMIPEEVREPALFLEGSVSVIQVNAYERNPAAREACIRHYGVTCAACGFDFGKVYGAVAQGLIHVHHIVPLSKIGKEYTLDPIKDLIPLCPNCHAVVHRGKDTLSIDELRACLRSDHP